MGGDGLGARDLRCHEVDARADLYALGAVAYFLLTGTPVFSGSGVVEVCGHQLHSLPERPSRRTAQAIPEDLERIVLDCLAKDRALRPESAEELARRLRECLDSSVWSEADAQSFWQSQAEAHGMLAGTLESGERSVEPVASETRCDLPACRRAA